MSAFLKPATARVVDFSTQRDLYYVRDDKGKIHVTTRDGIPFTSPMCITTESGEMTKGKRIANSPAPGTPMSMTEKQRRARARRRFRHGQRVTDESWEELYKPLEDWDEEELARGRPRNAAGTFSGPPPKYITRELHERAVERFKMLIRSEMNAHSLPALQTIKMVLESEEVDSRGRPIVSASSKMDAAKFLLEHIVGKPVQPTTSDISVKLQGILGQVMVIPGQDGNYTPAHIGSRGDPIEIEGEVVGEDEDA